MNNIQKDDKKVFRFVQIAKESLKNGESYPYNIYRKTDEKIFDLLLRKSEVFNKSLQCFLLDEKLTQIYIMEQDKHLYQEYIQKHITEILNDVHIHLDTKCSLIKEIASETMNDLFESDLNSENLKKVDKVLDSSIQLILSDKNAMYSMLKVTSYDYYTYTHCVDVATYAIGFGSYLKLEKKELEILGKAAMLHDIGKKLISYDIIGKKGKLTDEEFEAVKEHPLLSVEVLRQHGENDQKLIKLISQHHERCDGSGYPYGLVEEDIDNLAKVITICDVFNALTTRRTYKERMTSFEAFKIMCSDMKGHFCKEHLKKFINFMGCNMKDFDEIGHV